MENECNCKDCDHRAVGCHGKCEEYQRFYRERREINASKLEFKNLIYKHCRYNRGYDT